MSDHTPPNMRILRILEVLAHAERPLTPTEINDQLGWPKQTLHRLCQTLISDGYVEKFQRRLVPRKRLLSVAFGLTTHATSHAARHQILQNIARNVGETVNFVRPGIQGMMYADRVETNWPFRILLPIGTHVPFHCTASGKTYLANLPAAQRRKIIPSLDLQAFTNSTLSTIEQLEDELKQIRRQGYALDLEEFHDDMVAIAVPVYDDQKRFFAALAIHGPKQRFDKMAALDRLPLLLGSARQISEITSH
jgi:DNA-binding IclR family transcriptional regulator